MVITRTGRAAASPSGADRHRLGVVTGVAALGLDALASCAYGPEAIVLALAVAGAAGIGLTVPVTLMIVALLAVLVVCYRQVITAYPDGGGSYSVAHANLGRRAGLVAAASLVVDYVLNVAVSVAAGTAALTSAFPALLPWTPELCLAALLVVATVNLRGVLAGGRAFALPAAVFVAALLVLIAVGLIRGRPLHPLPPPTTSGMAASVGVLLVLAAFANGCAALTGVEAIANATPSFRADRARTARAAELSLGVLLGTLLIGLAVLIERFDVRPVEGRTVLSLLAEGSIGTGVGFLVVQFATVVLLMLAANTSYGGLPVLMARLARDGALPHVFGLRADRQVYRCGIAVLSVLAGGLLVFSGGQVTVLVPLFAIGVFIGFALCQAGMVRHWLRERGPRWRARLAINGAGAVLAGSAAVVVAVEKFTDGAWLIVLVVPLLVLLFSSVQRAYRRIGDALGVGAQPLRPRPASSVVVVPVVSITRLAARTLCAAMSMGDRVVAVHVAFGTEPEDLAAARDLQVRWSRWRPDVPMVQLGSAHRVIGPPIARYVRSLDAEHVLVLIGEVRPERWWEQALFNRRGGVVARYVGRHTRAVVCRLRFPLDRAEPPTAPPGGEARGPGQARVRSRAFTR
ncbi:APC family permease [Pseudonocardia spinosispora]|uniref:APC family permease n=1 Tax=Pseudonocardia spinosispora TaxID=103441 RepID=UPI0003F569DC|nr:APC family permease [Pseudonocardia spinosispora]